MKERPTLADVARAAGVSMMTVSRALNQKTGVSDALRARILALANRMDFLPNHVARGLATNQTRTIGLVVSDIANPFFAQIARGVESMAYDRGYSVFLINTMESVERELSAIQSLMQHRIDGAVLCSSRQSAESLHKIIQQFSAAVLLNRELKSPVPNVATINVNDQHAAHIAIQYLLKKGCRRIAYIAGPANSTSSNRRLKGYRAALQKAGISFDSQMVESGMPDTEGGRLAAAELLDRHPEVDAIYAFNDLMAVGAMQVCQERGRDIPKDLRIIGMDDIPLATIIRPQLTTLHLDLTSVGRLALSTLLNIMQGHKPSPSAIQIKSELVIRDSA
jgi:LacI family transcriptional regulator